jgi:hypothetical protein
VHLACTRYLTCMHTGDRSAKAIDAGGVLPGYAGVIARDGYAGYGHLTSALHAWCGVHLRRDLKGLHDFEPGQQRWAAQMASLLIEARDAAAAARAAGRPALDTTVLDDLVTRYRALATAGLTANLYRRTATAKDARRLARRLAAAAASLPCGGLTGARGPIGDHRAVGTIHRPHRGPGPRHQGTPGFGLRSRAHKRTLNPMSRGLLAGIRVRR